MGQWKDSNGKSLKHWTAIELTVLEEGRNSSSKELAKKLNRSVTSIDQARKRFGYLKIRRGKEETAEEIIKLHSQGLQDRQIAVKIGVSTRTVLAYRARLKLPTNGIKRKKPHIHIKSKFHTIQDGSKKCNTLKSVYSDQERKSLFYYTNDQNEFLLAVAKFRDKHGRVPTLIEGYRLAIELGWTKEGNNEQEQ